MWRQRYWQILKSALVDAKAPRMHLLTSVDFVSPQLKNFRSLNWFTKLFELIFFSWTLKRVNFLTDSFNKKLVHTLILFFCIMENVFYNFIIKKPISGDTFISFPFSNYTLVQCYFLHCDQVFHCWLFLLVLKLYIPRNKASFQPFHLTLKS